jgi:hypothetical protein
LNRRLVRPQSRSKRFGKEQKFLLMPEYELRIFQLGAQYTYYTALGGLRETWLKITAFFV